MMPPPTLLVFLKYPLPGSVKTRLAASIGHECAARQYRQWITLILTQLQSLRGSVRIVGCFDGAPQAAFSPWHGLVDDWWEQSAGDLGIRLEVAFETWQTGDASVAAIGTDCLDLDAALVHAAFQMLGETDAVFGPATDGGYYLVGMARYLPGFFEGVPWSAPETLAVHQEKCRQSRWSVGLLPERRDIDTWEDFAEYEQQGG